MKRWFLLALACSLPAPARAEAPDWHWEGPIAAGGEVELNLARASVRVVRRPGPARIEIKARGPQGLDGAWLRLEQIDRGVRVTDIYPPHPSFFRAECEAPDDGRGDFLHSKLVLDTLLYLPPGVEIAGHVMSRREPPARHVGQSRSGAPPGKNVR
ncbi:hypothetical protein [Allosphingosinicella sp.]|uniref:hypothetical protein n=1 Tax=Allosphingosinicella sp. TaxID=2823234 RepID=UPI002FC1DCB8